MTRITHEAEEAAAFILYGHKHIPMDNPAMASANRTLRAAGIWSTADVIAAQPTAPQIVVEVVGVFQAGDRRRVLHMVLADGIEVGTAINWTGKALYPWGLSLPAANLTNFGFRSRADLVAAVQRFVKTGEI